MSALAPGAADLILARGKIITVDDAFSIAESLAVRGERILAVGRDADVRALAGAGTRVLDLRGRAVVPGLVDGHAHMDREGLKAVYPSLEGARSIDDVLARVEALVRERAPGEWVVTMPIGDPPYYWDVPETLAEGRFPTRWELDRVSPRNPVYIRSIWGYWRHTTPLVSVANTQALRLAGITRETLPPWGGVQIDKDLATGEPTGIFYEWTMVPVVELSLMAVAPRFTHAERLGALPASMRAYGAHGTTSVFEEHGIAAEVLRVYQDLHARGGMTVRAHLVQSPSWGAAGSAPLPALLDAWAAWLGGRGLGDDWLRVSGLFASAEVTPDNAVRARAMPYTGWAGFAYDAALPRDRLRALLGECARRDIRVVTIGTDLLDLFEAANRAAPIGDRRWVVGHISTLTGDEVRRLRDLGCVLTTHTNRYVYKEGGRFAERLGPGAEETLVPLRSLRAAGVHVALATDNVPVSLFHPLWHVVARADRAGRPIAPGQRLSREDALRAATREGAYLTFDEDRKGSLEPGKLADLAVLSADPLTCEESALRDIVAETTLVGGRVVHEGGR
jgi:hypothetical protein